MQEKLKYCAQSVYNRSISLKCYFISHLIYDWRYYRQTAFIQLDIMVPYVDIIGLCHRVAILWQKYLMRRKCVWGGITSISSVRYLRGLVNKLWLCLPLKSHMVGAFQVKIPGAVQTFGRVGYRRLRIVLTNTRRIFCQPKNILKVIFFK